MDAIFLKPIPCSSMTGVTVSQLDGRVVAIKQAADDPDSEARLRTEAEVLALIDHPGVVQLIRFDDGPPPQLITCFVGPDNWARRLPTAPEEVIQGLARVVSTVADLHDAGLSHRALSLDHILIGPDRRPVICGLADARPIDDEGKEFDRLDLAALIKQVATDDDGPHHDQLAAIATQLANGCSPRDATAQLDALGRTNPDPARRSSPPVRAMAAGAMTLVAVATVAIVGMTDNRSAPAVAQPAAIPSTVSADPPAPTVGADPLDTPRSSAPPDRLDTPKSIATDAPVLVHSGRRYGIGEPGDLAVSGDWDCDSVPTPAVLRPSTGEVALFDDWPAPNLPLTASFVTVVEGAVSIAVDREAGCQQLRIRTNTGSRIIDLDQS